MHELGIARSSVARYANAKRVFIVEHFGGLQLRGAVLRLITKWQNSDEKILIDTDGVKSEVVSEVIKFC